MLSSRRFAPTLLGTVLAIVGIVGVGRLGLWQLGRADEKRQMLEQIDAGAASVHPLTAGDTQLPRYQTVTATGRYDGDHQVLLDNMPSRQGAPGYRVLTPFELREGGWILVDRGWVPLGPTREELPNVAVASDERTIRGRLDELPRPGMRLAAHATGEGWPRVMNFPEPADLENALGRPLGRYIVRLDPSERDGFERAGIVAPDFGPDRHIAYAVQWFGLGLAILCLYVFLSFRSKDTDDRTGPV
jgi:surfeit locus 1 family protein